jgi:hypothetical protein
VPWDKTLPFLHARDNVVEYNELHHMCEVMEDGNAVYLSGCGTGNEVRFNYVHHVTSRDHHGALRTDDLCRDSRWHHNVVQHCSYANFVLKHHNVVEDNLLIDPSAPLIGLLVVRLDPCDHSSVRRNIFYTSGDEELPFVRLEKARGLKEVDANVYWAGSNQEWADRGLQEMKAGGFEAGGRVLEVALRDPDNRDFRVVENSPLLELGIEGADVRQAGPRNPGEGDRADDSKTV